MTGRDFHEWIVVLGPKRDLPEAHEEPIAALGDIGGAVIRRPPMAGQIRSSRALLSYPREQDMDLLGTDNTRIWEKSNRNFTLRQYRRPQYRTPDIRWIVASPR